MSKRKNSPSDRARRARRLAERIEGATQERREMRPEATPFYVERLTDQLDELHGDKRQMRRDIYREAPDLEGKPVFKGQPGGRS